MSAIFNRDAVLGFRVDGLAVLATVQPQHAKCKPSIASDCSAVTSLLVAPGPLGTTYSKVVSKVPLLYGSSPITEISETSCYSAV